jgi:hypothetical protein
MEQTILQGLNNAYYILNSANKIELHLDGKDSYSSLPDAVKNDIKAAFIWGRQRGAWVSRSKDAGIPWRMRQYNIEFKGQEERRSFEESREMKIERAEHKAERYEAYAESREKKAESLQSEFNRLRKDWSWLTQPYVNTSGGRSFRNQKEKVMSRYERGLESYKIASQHREKSEHYKAMSQEKELQKESYLINRVKEGEKALRNYEKFEENYADALEKIDSLSGEAQAWLKARINYYETAFEKLAFYLDHLRELNIQKKEAGIISADEVTSKVRGGGLKKQVKEYLKEKYNIDLVALNKAYGEGTNTYYYIKTAQNLPTEYTSGWNAPNAAQIKISKMLTDIEKFNTK